MNNTIVYFINFYIKILNMEKDRIFQFSEIIKIEKYGKVYKFKLIENEEFSQDINECDKFIDPLFDQVFKEIFSQKNENERMLSGLNSLQFPNKETSKLFKINQWNNDSTIMNDGDFRCF